jgi:hypothetical protein
MSSIPDNINANISPTEFELLVKEYLEGSVKYLKDFFLSVGVPTNRNKGINF